MRTPPRPVLVTGSNRSGTTWVGRMLCLSGSLAYVHEPFNPGIWPRWTRSPIPHRNLYVTPANEATYLTDLRAVVERRFPWRAQLGEVGSPRAAARLVKAASVGAFQRALPRATLLKDPIAVFSTEWLAERFDLSVVVMVRGPLAFAASIKRLAWAFDFANWTRQDLLMQEVLAEFDDDVRRAAARPPGLIDQAILTWNATYAHVDRLRRAHPEWHVVSYERLATDPQAGFASLYQDLGLPFDQAARRGIARHTDVGNAVDVKDRDKGGIRRDSRAALDTWRTRLTDDEVAAVLEGTHSVAERLGPSLMSTT